MVFPFFQGFLFFFLGFFDVFCGVPRVFKDFIGC